MKCSLICLVMLGSVSFSVAQSIQPVNLPENVVLLDFTRDADGRALANGARVENRFQSLGIGFDDDDRITREVEIRSPPNNLTAGDQPSSSINATFDPPISLIGLWGFDFMVEAFDQRSVSLGTAIYTDGTAGLYGGDSEFGFAGIRSDKPIYRVRVSKSHNDSAFGFHTDDWVFLRAGDINASGFADIADMDLLTTALRIGSQKEIYDLNLDGQVDQQDRTTWVHDVKQTWFGDANLDGYFDSADLTRVFQSAEYEDGIALNSGWADGDWNGDGDFDSSDMIVAFRDGGYESGPRPVASVPEPQLVLPLLGTVLLRVGYSRRRRAA